MSGALTDDQRLQRLQEELLHAGRELSRLHRDLEGQRERLRRERAEREELLGVVSHELRTPMTVIGGYHRLLLKEEVGPLNPQQRKFLEESHRSCRRMDAFLGNLLEASSRDRAGEVLELGTAPLAPPIEAVVSMLETALEDRELSLALDLEPGLEARFDPVRLEQVLTNLIGNALKFTPRGGNLWVRARGFERPGEAVERWVEVCVRDDGPGVPEPERERVFEPYVRASGVRSEGGLGLGLAICRRLIEAHGGQIGLGERQGGGCAVRFTLPAVAPRPQTSTEGA